MNAMVSLYTLQHISH